MTANNTSAFTSDKKLYLLLQQIIERIRGIANLGIRDCDLYINVYKWQEVVFTSTAESIHDITNLGIRDCDLYINVYSWESEQNCCVPSATKESVSILKFLALGAVWYGIRRGGRGGSVKWCNIYVGFIMMQFLVMRKTDDKYCACFMNRWRYSGPSVDAKIIWTPRQSQKNYDPRKRGVIKAGFWSSLGKRQSKVAKNVIDTRNLSWSRKWTLFEKKNCLKLKNP